jgi:hypothetical protein
VLAKDLDQAGNIDRRRHVIRIAGAPRRLTPVFWRLLSCSTPTVAMSFAITGFVQSSTEMCGSLG